MKGRNTLKSVVLCLTLVLWGGLAGSVWAAGSLSAITVTPAASEEIFLGETVQFTATGTYSDGTSEDVSSQVVWTVSDLTAAAISESGLLSVASPANSHGSAISDSAGVKVSVTASLSGVLSAPASVTVINSGGPGIYYQSGGSASATNQTLVTSDLNKSGVKVTDGGKFSLSDSTISTTGESNAVGLSSAIGLNAGVLAENGAKVKISNCLITTTGSGANGAFAHGEGSLVELYNVKIRATGEAAHGVDATYMGDIIIEDSDLYTAAERGGAALSNDTGDGSVYATRVRTYTEGKASPGFYAIGSDSTFKITDSSLFAKTGEGGLMTTGAIIELTRTDVTGYTAGLSCSGGTMTIDGGDIVGTSGPGIMVIAGPGRGRMGGTATDGEQAESMPGGGESGGPMGGMPEGGMPGGMGEMPEGGMPGGEMAGNFQMMSMSSDIIVRGGATISGSTGEIINVSEESTGTFTAEGETLTGDMVVEEGSTLDVTLKGTTLTGRIHGAGLSLDAGSTWTVTADSFLTSLKDPDGISGSNVENIIGNGHTVYYDKDAATELSGRTYSLANGGTLTPGDVPASITDVSGDWAFEFTDIMGAQAWDVAFTANGENLDVTVKNAQTGEMKGTGTLAGDQIAFTVTQKGGGGDMFLEFTGTVAGDKMSGTREVFADPSGEGYIGGAKAGSEGASASAGQGGPGGPPTGGGQGAPPSGGQGGAPGGAPQGGGAPPGEMGQGGAPGGPSQGGSSDSDNLAADMWSATRK